MDISCYWANKLFIASNKFMEEMAKGYFLPKYKTKTMKTIRELRASIVQAQEVNSIVSIFAKNQKVDFDVFLPTKNTNLQRDFCWSLFQKQELIWSILKNRYIPRMAMVLLADDTFQVIDGKQRLSAMLDFYHGKFPLMINGGNYLFAELPKEYQSAISGYGFRYCIIHEDWGKTISDEYKIDWFLSINFAGTPQEDAHFLKLKQ